MYLEQKVEPQVNPLKKELESNYEHRVWNVYINQAYPHFPLTLHIYATL